MLYTVSFNPSLDYIVDVEPFNLGQVNRTKGELMFPGGKGINVSIVLNNLGFENTALGFYAGFTGNELERLLREEKVNADFIKVDEGMTRINVKIRGEKETEINGQGPAIKDEHIEKLYEKLDKLSEGDYLVLAGSIPECMPETMYMDIMDRLKDRGINIVVDATKDLLLNVLPYRPFLIKPNNYELAQMLGVTIENDDDIVKYARVLRERGARNVLISMAGDGAILVDENDKVTKMRPPKGKVKNSVGAGDSMVAGFIAGYLESNDYESAFRMGLCTGSASAFSDKLATKQEVLDLLKTI